MKKEEPFNNPLQESLKKNFGDLLQELKKKQEKHRDLSEKEKEEWNKSL